MNSYAAECRGRRWWWPLQRCSGHGHLRKHANKSCTVHPRQANAKTWVIKTSTHDRHYSRSRLFAELDLAARQTGRVRKDLAERDPVKRTVVGRTNIEQLSRSLVVLPTLHPGISQVSTTTNWETRVLSQVPARQSNAASAAAELTLIAE